MWIGVGRLVLDFYNNDDAADKRRRLETLCKDLRRKFNLSMLEVADHDDPERGVVGFAIVMKEDLREEQAKSLVQKVCEEIDSTAPGRVTVTDWDILSHGD